MAAYFAGRGICGGGRVRGLGALLGVGSVLNAQSGALKRASTFVAGKRLICSDHPEAMAVTTELVEKIPGMRPLDAGDLSNACAIEAFTAVLLQLNTHYKTRAAVKFTGIDI